MKTHLMGFQIIPICKKIKIKLTFLIRHRMDMILRAADTIIFKSFNIKKFKVLLTNNLFKHCLKLNRSLSKLKKFIKIT
jgi:hypothetical protein